MQALQRHEGPRGIPRGIPRGPVPCCRPPQAAAGRRRPPQAAMKRRAAEGRTILFGFALCAEGFSGHKKSTKHLRPKIQSPPKSVWGLCGLSPTSHLGVWGPHELHSKAGLTVASMMCLRSPNSELFSRYAHFCVLRSCRRTKPQKWAYLENSSEFGDLMHHIRKLASQWLQ